MKTVLYLEPFHQQKFCKKRHARISCAASRAYRRASERHAGKQNKTQTRWNLRYFPDKLPLKGVAERAAVLLPLTSPASQVVTRGVFDSDKCEQRRPGRVIIRYPPGTDCAGEFCCYSECEPTRFQQQYRSGVRGMLGKARRFHWFKTHSEGSLHCSEGTVVKGEEGKETDKHV
eukprot:6213263-Pleurochrysis_carterae.AAC.4